MASEEIKNTQKATKPKSTANKQVTKKADESAALKKEIEELKEQLKSQMDLITELNAQKAVVLESKQSKVVEKNIPFVNLTCGTLNLKGHRIYELKGQFARRSFPEKEAREIVNNSHNAITKGLVYIADADFVEENDLSYMYEEILSDSELRDLLKHDITYVLEVYKSAPIDQKRIISDMVANKVMNKQSVDANILIQLGQLTGINYMDLEPLDVEGD